ncbi:MAG: hypothetical protein ACYTAF_11645 [Planctomycetota bacterium]|jgi:hypothetical protein
MPVQFYNLGFHLFQADASQQLQNMHEAAARGGNEAAQAKNEDQGRDQSTGSVQDTKETENNEIQGESRGAHAHVLSEEEEEEKKEEEQKKRPPEDPSGKGRLVDVSI